MKIKLKKSVAFAVFAAVFLGKETELFWGYAAALLHECAHLAMCVGLKQTPKQITFGVCGMNLNIQSASGIKERMMILASGPVSSFFMFGALFLLRHGGVMELPLFEFANLCIGIANLIPALPLDGGSMLKCALVSKLGVINGAKVMRTVTNVLIGCICLLYAIIIGTGASNPFFVMFAVFLICSSGKERKRELFEKKLVLSGQMPASGKLKYFALDARCELLYAAAKLSPSYYMIAAVFENGRYIGEINQSQIPSAIHRYGAACSVGEYLALRKPQPEVY